MEQRSTQAKACGKSCKPLWKYITAEWRGDWRYGNDMVMMETMLVLKLGDGQAVDPGEWRRARSAALQEEEEKESHHAVLLRLHGSDHHWVCDALCGSRREQPGRSAAGRGRELDCGAGQPNSEFPIRVTLSVFGWSDWKVWAFCHSGEGSGVDEGGDFKPLPWLLPALVSWPLHPAVSEERNSVWDLRQAPSLPDSGLYSLLERYRCRSKTEA